MKGELNGYRVEIPDPPVVEGWEAVEYGRWERGDWIVDSRHEPFQATFDAEYGSQLWIMRRKPRRRIVFEECPHPNFDTNGAAYAVTTCGFVERVWPNLVHAYMISCWLRRTDEEVVE